MLKYIASIPVVLSILAATYGAFNYTSKLTAQIDESTTTIALLQVEIENLEQRVYGDIDNIHAIFTDKTGRNSKNYADAREELPRGGDRGAHLDSRPHHARRVAAIPRLHRARQRLRQSVSVGGCAPIEDVARRGQHRVSGLRAATSTAQAGH